MSCSICRNRREAADGYDLQVLRGSDRLCQDELRVNNSSDNRYAHFYAGIDPQTGDYILEPKEVFTTPKLAFSFSKEGLSGVSRNFHRWAPLKIWLNWP